MKKKILLTRPRGPSERWASLLARHGFESDIEPLLTIVPTAEPRPAGAFEAVMLTSASTIDALRARGGEIADLLPLPCFCVGSATAEAARSLGFGDISSGTSDGAILAQAVVAAAGGKSLRLLHISGDLVDGKAQDILAKNGIDMVMWHVYRADEAENFTTEIRNRFEMGAYGAAPVFSPRTARVLVSLIEKNRLTESCHAMTAIALSQPVADALQTLPWRRLRVAASPAEDDMLACLKAEDAVLQNETAKPAPFATTAPPAAPPRRKRGTLFLWGFMTVLLLAASASIVILQISALHGAPHQNEQTQPMHIVAPVAEQPVQTTERAETAQSANPAPPAIDTTKFASAADLATLNDEIRALRGQIAQLQGQAQKSMAAAIAFTDLREDVKDGKPFAGSLATLRMAGAGDAAIEEQTAKLQPFAESGAPTLAQLRDMLKADEAGLAGPAPQAGQHWWDRLKTILQSLVSIHPLHDPQAAGVEAALDNGDMAGASAAFETLPQATQRGLAAWRQKLAARLTADEALRAIGAHLTAPAAAPDNTP